MKLVASLKSLRPERRQVAMNQGCLDRFCLQRRVPSDEKKVE
jgi:hypothetical protein